MLQDEIDDYEIRAYLDDVSEEQLLRLKNIIHENDDRDREP